MQQLQLSRPRTGKRVGPKAAAKSKAGLKSRRARKGGLSFRRLAGIANDAAVISPPAAPLSVSVSIPFTCFSWFARTQITSLNPMRGENTHCFQTTLLLSSRDKMQSFFSPEHVMHSDDKDSQTASVHANGKTATAHQDFLRGQICLFGDLFVLCGAACAFSGVGLDAQGVSSLEQSDSKPGRSELTRQAGVYCVLQLTVGKQRIFLSLSGVYGHTSGCVSKHKVWLVASPLRTLVAVFTHLLRHHKSSQKVELWFFGGVGGGGGFNVDVGAGRGQ